jgi:signal transduction histidine kinase
LFGTIENDKDLNKKGIGLGLYICKKICNQFEGDIEVVSDLGKGSIFTFTMKVYDNINKNSTNEF